MTYGVPVLVFSFAAHAIQWRLTIILQEEIERLELQQRVFNRVFDDRLIFPPVRHPRKILECGYGSGAWAVEVAEENEDCEVTAMSMDVVSAARHVNLESVCSGNRRGYLSAHAA
jgi:tRNA G46 methylase TrmB